MKIIKIAIFSFVFLVGSQGIGICGLVDETRQGQEVSAEDIPNRPMREDANLKAIQTAFDKSDPRANIKRFAYDPGITFKIRLREFMGGTIVLPEGEKIAGWSLFDEHNFTFTPMSEKNPVLTNSFVVYAKFHGADTNLTVHGKSGNIYSFYLRVDSTKSIFMPSLVTYIVDIKTTKAIKDRDMAIKMAKEVVEAETETKTKEKKKQDSDNDYLASLPTKIAPGSLNFAYESRGGNKKIKPIRVFDDGYFTFFQFGKDDMDKITTLPTIYRVVEGYDNPVNTRVDGGYVIAETISDKWTLRSGETHFCVWKEKE